jgi:hypothetical protein
MYLVAINPFPYAYLLLVGNVQLPLATPISLQLKTIFGENS